MTEKNTVSTEKVSYRFAKPEDADALSEIYRPYVENTAITLEYNPPSADEFRERIVEISGQFPYIVCEIGREIAGYAYAHHYRTRYGFRYCAELSVYLKEEYSGRGIGTKIYSSLIAILKRLGFADLYGVIVVPNRASERLHEKLGFEKICHDDKSGYKFGKRLDLGYYRLVLSEDLPEGGEFAEPLRFDRLSREEAISFLPEE